jgi:hypothetical protein
VSNSQLDRPNVTTGDAIRSGGVPHYLAAMVRRLINPASRQSTWGSKRPLPVDAIRDAWGSIREQVLSRDLLLATRIETPSGALHIG